MIRSKLFSVKKDKNIILYQVLIDDVKLNKFLDLLESRYSKVETDSVETTFAGIVPLSYGKYDSMGELCEVKDLGIIDTKRERNSEDYYKSLSAATKEWDFLSLEEKMDYMPVEGTRKARVKLEIYYPSILVKRIRETLLTDNNECIIDGTDLIKLFNHVHGLNNIFEFDKTIDLSKKNKKWDDPSRAFLSIIDYQEYLRNADSIINRDDVELTSKEMKELKNDFGFVVQGLRRCMAGEQIGMFPMDIELSDDLEILKRFAIRNEELDWFNSIFEYAPINYDGGKVLGDYRKTVLENYDLNGTSKEKNIIRSINDRTNIFANLEEQNDKKVDVLTKKIKPAA